MLATVEDQEKTWFNFVKTSNNYNLNVDLLRQKTIELTNYKDSLVLLTLDLGITKVSYQEIFMVR